MWADGDPESLLSRAQAAWERAEADGDADSPLTYLALSGGGADGAFGAGFLAGWTEAGTRPEFDTVAGVSTGALIAPFAFAGPDWDDALRDAYTGTGASTLLQSDGYLFGLLGSALFRGEPLRERVESFVTPALLKAVADGYAEGRRLVVVTTNLDAQRPVLWEMGAIASSDRPDRADLFRDILVASASIPGVFPPVMIETESGGQPVVEMHVDGGTATPVFTLPDTAPGLIENLPHTERRPRLYAIVNNALMPTHETVPARTLTIASTAFSTMVRNHTRAVLGTTRAPSDQLGFDFAATWIPTGAAGEDLTDFDPAHMKKLYRIGFNMGKTGAAWHGTLPASVP